MPGINKLAIVIPAYKIEYLNDCLLSIANQTNKNFKVYIGNDYSPDDLGSIVDKYCSKFDLEYTKFSKNLGSVSLVKHWERCIDMTEDEKWIWLFSDDDKMDPGCVQSFFNIQRDRQNDILFRFNLDVINSRGEIERSNKYPETEHLIDFLINRFSFKCDSAIVNYIFSREVYQEFNFQEFPLAWCTDDASVVSFSKGNAIITIPDSSVQWRVSGANISSVGNDHIQKQKVYARLQFIKWLYALKNFDDLKLPENKKIVLNWMVSSIDKEYLTFTRREKKALYNETGRIIGKPVRKYNSRAYLGRLIKFLMKT